MDPRPEYHAPNHIEYGSVHPFRLPVGSRGPGLSYLASYAGLLAKKLHIPILPASVGPPDVDPAGKFVHEPGEKMFEHLGSPVFRGGREYTHIVRKMVDEHHKKTVSTPITGRGGSL